MRALFENWDPRGKGHSGLVHETQMETAK